MNPTTVAPSAPCPCDSGRSFIDCCGPLLGGVREAATAQELMRSRYTAYTLADHAYIARTWHGSTRPSSLAPDASTHWLGLEVIGTVKGRGSDEAGEVEFVARFKAGGRAGRLHERSRFVREGGRWYYVDGDLFEDAPAPARTSRNAPCPCGSGRKYKHCHASSGNSSP